MAPVGKTAPTGAKPNGVRGGVGNGGHPPVHHAIMGGEGGGNIRSAPAHRPIIGVGGGRGRGRTPNRAVGTNKNHAPVNENKNSGVSIEFENPFTLPNDNDIFHLPEEQPETDEEKPKKKVLAAHEKTTYISRMNATDTKIVKVGGLSISYSVKRL